VARLAERVAIVLASGSAARRGLLALAGVVFDVVPADIDEDAFRAANAAKAPEDIARLLAREKASHVSAALPDALVIGADQALALGREIFGKAKDLAEARRVLSRLRGQTHDLYSAAAIAGNGTIVWERMATARMTMRAFSDEFLTRYLESEGEGILASVGCYKIEGLGVQLFDRIEGDHATILGLPLLPVLAELRRRGALFS